MRREGVPALPLPAEPRHATTRQLQSSPSRLFASRNAGNLNWVYFYYAAAWTMVRCKEMHGTIDDPARGPSLKFCMLVVAAGVSDSGRGITNPPAPFTHTPLPPSHVFPLL